MASFAFGFLPFYYKCPPINLTLSMLFNTVKHWSFVFSANVLLLLMILKATLTLQNKEKFSYFEWALGNQHFDCY